MVCKSGLQEQPPFHQGLQPESHSSRNEHPGPGGSPLGCSGPRSRQRPLSSTPRQSHRSCLSHTPSVQLHGQRESVGKQARFCHVTLNTLWLRPTSSLSPAGAFMAWPRLPAFSPSLLPFLTPLLLLLVSGRQSATQGLCPGRVRDFHGALSPV